MTEDLTEKGYIEALWGLLCPDAGPEDWDALVRWAAQHPDAKACVEALAADLPVVDDLADFEEVTAVLSAGTIRRVRRVVTDGTD